MSRSRQTRQAARQRGRAAETLCVWWLRLKGYRIIGRDLRTPVGEIDILARRGDTLAVIEVKARATQDDAGAAILPAQQRRIARALDWVVQRRGDLQALSPRFDAMLIGGGRLPRHLTDAWRIE
ncbi:MAG: YraN family protein [Alphaproteobacteria bacterium]|nr:YraN family protein [Alphaproteobacteria bacterium]MBU0797652.1 YraN family protein [Alphaproteobacteria bacterium]MBU0886391.1 YraN family protein [Alphaproteobacteria bacterium]MBU1813413.1 YraN family protein [Alphaproteobacteria bacterium]MBU2089757.1 YraN family protein [Alphaproteobacteria bacterium]